MSLDLSTLRARLQLALGDEFTVGALLGEGGFAAVFRVRDSALRRDVAVKVLDLGQTPSPVLAERFVREARTVAKLEHASIVPIYKVGGYKNEVLYIIMRCVDGPSLRQLLEKHHRLSVGDAARIARQVADALAYAHKLGVVHRDVKPDNILLDGTGRVMVTDFGIAKATEAASSGATLTTEGMVIGTPQYMSPEQATGDRTDSLLPRYRALPHALGRAAVRRGVGAVDPHEAGDGDPDADPQPPRRRAGGARPRARSHAGEGSRRALPGRRGAEPRPGPGPADRRARPGQSSARRHVARHRVARASRGRRMSVGRGVPGRRGRRDLDRVQPAP
ncbi:MAG: hypothetical protein DMD49_07270 [Gemmatimonadetes bacterium]|nr:MAG: hypothetical protein DMD49_07270 [Gemmatimonadota bacterium]